jgi:hypothetical protein
MSSKLYKCNYAIPHISDYTIPHISDYTIQFISDHKSYNVHKMSNHKIESSIYDIFAKFLSCEIHDLSALKNTELAYVSIHGEFRYKT